MQFERSQPDKLAKHPASRLQVEKTTARTTELLAGGLLVAVVVCVACLFGVWTRLAGQLAVFWPANALLLGILLRYPRLDTSFGWAGACVGYLFSGYLVGDAPTASILLTLCNLSSVVTGYLLLVRPGSQARQLTGAAGVLQLLGMVGLASMAGGVAGSIVGPMVFNGTPLRSGQAWLVSELVNYIAILPAMLTIPSAQARPKVRQWRPNPPRWSRLAPLLALLVSLACALAVGGPGAVAFPVPALLWCGMRYGVFGTSVLTLLTTSWTLVAISKGMLDISARIDTPNLLMSVRLGVTLVAVSPLAVASAMAANNSLLARLRHMAEHDPLTGTMNRRAFAEHAGRALQAARKAQQPAGLLILDIDHFKAVNDNHGHSAGDQVIVHVTNCLRQHLPPGRPLLGRLGGEEFAVLLPGCHVARTREVAENMRQTCADVPVDIGAGRKITVTVSIGACIAAPAAEHLDALLQAADRALYEAKNAGRDRVVVCDV